MRSIIVLVCAAGLFCASPVALAQTNVGVYFSFQVVQGNTTNYSEAVSVSTFPGTPVFSRTGTVLGTYSNPGLSFTAFDGSVWPSGLAATWRGEAGGGSDNNSWQVTLDTTGVSGLAVRFKYRLNGVMSGGALLTNLTAFEYQTGTNAFQPVPGAALALNNNADYNTNIWTASLAGLTNLQNQTNLTLRWRLPDFDQVAGTQLRMDDLQITGLMGGATNPPARAGKYNVLFVVVDDLKANFGPFLTPLLAAQMPRPVTPNMDALAAKGMAFTRAQCQQGVCSPSRTSVLTGLRPDTSKVWDLTTSFRDTIPNVITLPQQCKNQGYRSSAYGKVFHGGQPPSQDVPLSFDLENNGSPPHNYYENGHWQVESNALTGKNSLFATDAGVTNYWVTPARPVTNDDYVDGLIASRSIAQLQTYASNYLASGERFFLAVGFHKPHLPFVCPKQYWDLYDPAQINLTGYDGTVTMPSNTLAFTAPYSSEPVSYDDVDGTNDVGVINVTDARRLIHAYLACTSHADAELGRVLAALDATGMASNTIIVLWGDHGWHLGDHNGFWTKHSNYEEVARAPLIFVVPGMAALGTAGGTCAAPVEFVDIFPTILDLCELPVPVQPAGLAPQGTSLRPLLLGDPRQPWKRGAFTQYQRYIAGAGIAHQGNGMGYSIRTRRYRYTEWWRTASTATNAQGDVIDRDVKLYSTPEFRELYDLTLDPGETVNYAADPAYTNLVAELSVAVAGGYGWTNASVAAPANYLTNFAAWQAAVVEPGYALTNFAAALDPDGDGIPNLMEYAFGTDPLVKDFNLPAASSTNFNGVRRCALDYPVISVRTDVSAQPLMSTNLVFWTTNGVTSENLGVSAGQTLWRSSIPLDVGGPRAGFLRLKVKR